MRQHSDAEWHGSLDAATIARDGYVDLGEITAAGANGPDLAGDRELFYQLALGSSKKTRTHAAAIDHGARSVLLVDPLDADQSANPKRLVLKTNGQKAAYERLVERVQRVTGKRGVRPMGELPLPDRLGVRWSRSKGRQASLSSSQLRTPGLVQWWLTIFNRHAAASAHRGRPILVGAARRL